MPDNMIQPQAQPQVQQGPVQPQAPIQPPTKHTEPKKSGREGQDYNPDLMPKLEDHLNKLPPEQQKFLTEYMTPELAVILGIVLGHEAFDYFKKFADPKKQLSVQPRQQGSTQAPQQNTSQPQQAQSAAPAPIKPQSSTPPARSIMGV